MYSLIYLVPHNFDETSVAIWVELLEPTMKYVV